MITIVTQCSIDRLPQLRSMCQAWSGIVSVAVYIKENVELCKERLNELFHEMERCYSVVLDISLLYENVCNYIFVYMYIFRVTICSVDICIYV